MIENAIFAKAIVIGEMKKLFEKVKVIAFDADDTLWVNEPYFRDVEVEYGKLLERFAPVKDIVGKLFEVEMKNLAPYGYGAKAFTLSLMETAIWFSKQYPDKAPLTPAEMEQIMELGTSLTRITISRIPWVEELLKKLSGCGKYTIIVATKGDLLEQQTKLKRSGLEHYFSHVEVMSNKQESDYLRLLNILKCSPDEFVMIGNSMKSDILPVLNIGGSAIYIPFHTTWEHEKVHEEVVHPLLYECESCKELLELEF